MANKEKKDIVLENLKGFVRKGAASSSSGNIPTGHFNLDFVIHYGELPEDMDFAELEDYDPSKVLGIPLGKVVELFGEEGGGKSSLAYRIVGFAQKLGYKAHWIDTEHSFADNLAELNGVDRDNLYYSDMTNKEDPDKLFHAEDVFDNIILSIKSGVSVIVLDSVANLVPKERMEASAEKGSVAKLARLMSENLGKIVAYADKYGALVVFINQLRINVGQLWGNPETTPGGRSLKHNSSLRIQISKMGSKDAEIIQVDDNGKDNVIGRKSRIKVAKNRFAKPCFQTFPIPIYYKAHFPDINEILFSAGRQLKIISVRKGIFKWSDGDESCVGEGQSKFIDSIKFNELTHILAKSIENKAKESGTILAPEIVQWLSSQEKKNKVVDKNDDKEQKKVTRGRKRKGSSTVAEDAIL